MTTAHAVNASFTGSCLCGKVSYEIETGLKKFYFCHCSQCQKQTGSAFASNLLCEPVPVKWLKGEAMMTRFDYPGRSFSNVFCRECGSGLPFLTANGETLIIPAGSLDSLPDQVVSLKPDHQIFWEEHADWLEDGLKADKAMGFSA